MSKVVAVVGMGGGREPFLWSAWSQSFCCGGMNRGLPVLCTVLLWSRGQPGRQALESRSPEFKFWFYSSPAGSTGKMLCVPEPVPQPHNWGNSAYTPGLL